MPQKRNKNVFLRFLSYEMLIQIGNIGVVGFRTVGPIASAVVVLGARSSESLMMRGLPRK